MSEIKPQHTSGNEDWTPDMTGKYNLIDNKGVKVYPESPKTMRQSTADKKRDAEAQEQANSKEKKITIFKSYMIMDETELQTNGIKGCRLSLTMFLRSKPYDILMIILIVLYTLLIFLILSLVDSFFSNSQDVFYIIELAILGVFCVDISLHIIALSRLYLREYWNVIDLAIIILSVIFVLLDLLVQNAALQGFLKIRGIFRFLRIFLLIRKLNTLRVKRQIQKRQLTANGYDLRSPLEIVLEILTNLRDQIDIDQQKVIQDINYCIKMISSNQLYEAKLDFEGGLGDGKDQKDLMMLMQNYSKGGGQERKEEDSKKRRGSHIQLSPLPAIGGNSTSTYEDQAQLKKNVTTSTIETLLKVKGDTRAELRKIEMLDFNIFKIQEDTQGNELVAVTSYILAKENLFSKLSISLETFMKFVQRIQGGYKDVTYHNKTHGSDLSQTFYYFARSCNLVDKCHIDDLEMMILMVAGACHDHEHFGFNNVYLVETRDPIAIRYNDVSVLENHHVASSFSIIQEQGYNILESLNKDDYKRARSLMIQTILGTDMSKHFSELGKYKTRLSAQDFDPKGTDKDITLVLMFHLADISNATKNWGLCQKWTDLLFVEFFHQGDLERNRGATISYLMDRTTVNVAKAQIGFLDVIISPAFEAAAKVVDLDQNLANINGNKAKWQERFDEYEEKMAQDKERMMKLTSFN